MLQRSLRQYDTPNGKVEYEKIISSAEKLCPQQLKQIYGMSFGANITVHKLMLYQLYDELTGGYGKDTKISTSTVINESNKKALIFFDVDLEENFVNYYRVWAEVIPAEDEMGGTFKAVSSEWLAYVKAGTLPGQLLTERGNTTVTVNRKFGKTLAKIAPLLIPIQVVEIIEMAEKNKFIKIEKLLGELTESFLENSGIEWTRYNLDLSTLDFVAKRHFLKINIDINSRITEDAKYNVERIPVASNTPNTKYCGWRNDIFNAVTSYCFELYLNSTENRLRNDIQSMSVTGVPYSSSFVRLTCVKDYNEGTMGVFKVNPKIRPSGVLYLPNT
ncbi:uncharacterized protein LOC126837018 [Adelges cooleyi]|uniref:uncharacterized protein LOC126837018 n=1 Tax=Adelges cooleyi TaxID=133065 RepID=UPI0021806C3A|nr:uncharacterized protein LOC126837018 [Adelges cooleyi]